MTISSRFHTTLLFSACFLLSNYLYENRYNILDPNITKGVEDDRKASGNLLESVKLDENLYRLGHTKARFSFKERFNIALIKQLQNEQKKKAFQFQLETSWCQKLSCCNIEESFIEKTQCLSFSINRISHPEPIRVYLVNILASMNDKEDSDLLIWSACCVCRVCMLCLVVTCGFSFT